MSGAAGARKVGAQRCLDDENDDAAAAVCLQYYASSYARLCDRKKPTAAAAACIKLYDWRTLCAISSGSLPLLLLCLPARSNATQSSDYTTYIYFYCMHLNVAERECVCVVETHGFIAATTHRATHHCTYDTQQRRTIAPLRRRVAVVAVVVVMGPLIKPHKIRESFGVWCVYSFFVLRVGSAFDR